MWAMLGMAALSPLLFTVRARAGAGRQVAMMSLLVAGLLFLAQAVEIQATTDWPVLQAVDEVIREFGRAFRGEGWIEPVMVVHGAVTQLGRDGAAALFIAAALPCLWGAWKRR
jgi:hypothetical protein